MSTKDKGWTNIRVKNSIVNDIKQFLKENPAFTSQPQVVEFAIKKLVEKKK